MRVSNWIWVVMVGLGACEADDPAQDDADDVDETDIVGDDTDDTDDTDAADTDPEDTDPPDTDDAEIGVPNNVSGLTECPAEMPPHTLCADIQGYGVALFPLIQAQANVITGSTGEEDGWGDGVSLQLKGVPGGQLFEGEANCNSDDGPVGVYVFLGIGVPGTYLQWDEEGAGASCTQNLVTLGQMALESSGTFTATLVRRGDETPETIDVDGVFRIHGEAE